MRHEFRLQDPGEGVAEVEINEILVAEGDEVTEGADVFVVESDKAAVELPSPYTGRVVEIRVSQGDVAAVGDVLMVVEDEEDGEEAEAQDEEGRGERQRSQEPAGEHGEKPEDEGEDKPEQPHRERPEDRREEEPDDAREEEPEEERPREPSRRTSGSGAAREKATQRPERRGKAEPEEPAGKRAARRKPDGEGDRRSERDRRPPEDAPVRAAPAARRLAEEKDLDLSDIEPTGRDGQITVEDVENALEAAAKPARPAREAPPEAAGTPDEDAFGPVERVPLRSIRAATARAMTRAWSTIPHVVHEDLADITELERWRRRLARDGEAEITLTPILAKAAVAVLRNHPRFNATFDGEAGEIVLRRYYNVNVAVATPRGLIAPVLRSVDRKPIRALSAELVELSGRMREGRPSKADLEGGTFTITNVGGLGGTSFAPLINPPQTAILGIARARLAPVVTGDLDTLDNARTRVRLMAPLVLAFDHRAIDGADAARFMNELMALLADPMRLLLDA